MAILVTIGVITASPVIIAFNPNGIASLYNVTFEDDTVLLLIRHRQVMLGILGAALVYGAFFYHLRMMVIAAAIVSKLAFIGLYTTTPDLTQGIQRVIYFDAVSIILLLIGAVIFWRLPSD
ncbi:MAG: hypothetical protein HC866_15645 [Leptolyngbyaceae cyanobacterium RU_5_1]|nr:hypothetical protein [Leptolyngbyaceae cyanobacterium RU_5_1]